LVADHWDLITNLDDNSGFIETHSYIIG
jgi:hypothetical protein